MLPGKKYAPEDVLRILWNRRWMIIIPFVTVSLVTAAVAWKLPNRYRSQTIYLVVPQRVPETYVKSTVTTKMDERLAAIKQDVLSRPRLERLIQEYQLYASERRFQMMDDIVERMRRDIVIESVRGDAFRVSYVSHDPRTARDVTEKLATAVQDTSLNERNNQAQNTATFLESELAEKRRQLDDNDRRLATFKELHAGELPDEADANKRAQDIAQDRLRDVSRGIQDDRVQKDRLERTISDLMETPRTPRPAGTSADDGGGTGMSAAAQLEAAKARLQALEQRYTADWPEVRKWKTIVKDLQAKADAEALQRPVSPGAVERPATPEEAQRLAKIKGLQIELAAIETRIRNGQEEERRLRGVIQTYQARIETAPRLEPELTKLTRDNETLRTAYNEGLRKQQEAKSAANLENRQIGETFRQVDPPRLPQRPISPNRPLILLIGAGLGLAIGLACVAGLEYKDNSFRTDDEIVRMLSLPVLAVIPLMLSRKERRKQRRQALMLAVGATVLLLAVAAGTSWFLLFR